MIKSRFTIRQILFEFEMHLIHVKAFGLMACKKPEVCSESSEHQLDAGETPHCKGNQNRGLDRSMTWTAGRWARLIVCPGALQSAPQQHRPKS